MVTLTIVIKKIINNQLERSEYMDELIIINNQTLFFVTTVIMIVITFVLFAYSMTYKISSGLRFLVYGNEFYALHFIFSFVNGYFAKFPFAILVGFFELIAIMLWCISLLIILDIPIKIPFLIKMNVINIVGIIFFRYIYANTGIRRSVTSFIISVILIETAIQITKSKKNHKISTHKITAYIIFIYSGVKILMGLYRLVIPVNIKTVFDVNTSVSVYTLIYLSFAIVINFAVIFLENDIMHDKVSDLSYKDHLTNIYNRRYFLERLEEMMELHDRDQINFAIFLVDIDDFKAVNDTYGHNIGDEVLIEVTEFLKKQLGKIDLIARYGGEEFIMILQTDEINSLKKLIDRILVNIRKTSFTKEKISITLSGGVVIVNEALIEKSIDDIIDIADQRLYEAKNKGKDRIVIE